jgi:cobalamin biosynthetic protein CobC
MLPHLARARRARILAPTYSEYAPRLTAAGWQVEEVGDLDALAGADLAIVVNPNNPDGRRHDPIALLAMRLLVDRLVVDESFADAVPGLSLASEAGREGLLVLRSVGKFYGLAGLRLGFVLGCEADVAVLAGMTGPWPVSGPAVEIGRRALLDRDWALATTSRLAREALRLDALADSVGWRLVGGTPLFRLYETGNGRAVQERLAGSRIWSRIFEARAGWLRLGLPGEEMEWLRLAAALSK